MVNLLVKYFPNRLVNSIDVWLILQQIKLAITAVLFLKIIIK